MRRVLIWLKAAYNRLVEFGLDLSQEPVEGLGAEAELLGHAARAERGAQVDVEEQRGVLLGLPTQGVVAVHDHQLLAQLMGACVHGQENKKTKKSIMCYIQSRIIDRPNKNNVLLNLLILY